MAGNQHASAGELRLNGRNEAETPIAGQLKKTASGIFRIPLPFSPWTRHRYPTPRHLRLGDQSSLAAKQIMAWISDEPMIYDKLTPSEYLEFVRWRPALWRYRYLVAVVAGGAIGY